MGKPKIIKEPPRGVTRIKNLLDARSGKPVLTTKALCEMLGYNNVKSVRDYVGSRWLPGYSVKLVPDGHIWGHPHEIKTLVNEIKTDPSF